MCLVSASKHSLKYINILSTKSTSSEKKTMLSLNHPLRVSKIQALHVPKTMKTAHVFAVSIIYVLSAWSRLNQDFMLKMLLMTIDF